LHALYKKVAPIMANEQKKRKKNIKGDT